VGAGAMGELLALEARRRRIQITVASRHESRAAALAAVVSGRGIGLAQAAREAASHDGIAIALAGPWLAWNADAALQPIVDLSSPPAITPPRHATYLDIDDLHRQGEAAPPTNDQLTYAAAATAVVELAAETFERWVGGRTSVATLRGLRDSAERRRALETQRLLRRMPDLEPSEKALVEAFSRRLVAALLHEPSCRLREDTDGRAAAAAHRLFDL
jgi:glutamyl-tRNA reductase